MNAVEQADASRDADGGWDHIETGKPRHFTGQQTGPPVVHNNDGIVDEKKCLQHGLRIAWTPPLRRGIENQRRTWCTNGTAEEPRVTPEEEQFLSQYEVFQKLEQSSAQVLDAIAQVLARLTTLEESAQQREEAMLAALRGNPQPRPGTVPAGEPYAGAGNPISWPRLFVLIGVIVIIVAAMYYAVSR